MKTERMRLEVVDDDSLQIVKSYLASIEQRDMAALSRTLHPEVELIHANYPAVNGRSGAVDMIAGYLSIVDSFEFEVHAIFGSNGLFAVEKINIARAPNAAYARIRTVTVIEIGETSLITRLRIYADTSGLFQLHQAEKKLNAT